MLHVKPEQSQLCEAALIKRAKSGDQAAYTLLYELHIKRVYGICLRLLADSVACRGCGPRSVCTGVAQSSAV